MNCPICERELTNKLELYGYPGMCWECWWDEADWKQEQQDFHTLMKEIFMAVIEMEDLWEPR